MLTGQFVLRDENTTANPYATRLYGLGISKGRTVFYLPNASGTRTAFLAILAQGARFRDDLGCSRAIRVYYAGFELAEFDSFGQRQWKFHKGTVASAPNWKAIQAVNTTTNVWQVNSHGLNTGDPIAIWARGTTPVIPAEPTNLLKLQYARWTVWKVDNNNIKILNQPWVEGITADENQAFDITDSGTNLNEIFVFKGDSWIWDPAQGRPHFFQGTPFTFSGLSYIEVLLPAHLSDGENEPQNLKVLLEGKEMYDLQITSGNLAFNTGSISARANNAMILADAVVNDAKRPITRLNAAKTIAFRDRCDELIPWAGGNDVPAALADFATKVGVTYTASLAKLQTSAPPTGWGTAYAVTAQYTRPTMASCEFRYTGGSLACTFTDVNTGSEAATRQGLQITNGLLYYQDYAGVNANWEIMPVGVGDKLKIAYEHGLFLIYRNGVPLPIPQNTFTQRFTTFYIDIRFNSDTYVDELLIAPSGTASLPRLVTRYTGAMAASAPVSVADAIDAQIHLAPGCSWADVDGQIHVATEPDRTPCFTFVHDPDNPATASNVAKLTVKRKKIQDTYNFWTYTYRDSDDPILTRKFVPIDRKERRAANGGKLSFAGAVPYGVMNQSQMERLGETRARLESDLDTGFVVEAFLDSLVVTKGSFVNVVDPVAGYPAGSPALCMVVDERLSMAGVETRTYELQIITPDFYSDTDHGVVYPSGGHNTTIPFIPPAPASDLTLTESTEPLPDGRYASSISGSVEFDDGSSSQRARIFQKLLTNKLGNVTLNHTTDTFTLLSGAPDNDTEVYLVSTSNALPDNAVLDRVYYVVNSSGTTFKLSLTSGGTAENFASNGANLQIYDNAALPVWQDTGISVQPDAAALGAFEIIPARVGVALVRAQTISAAGVTLPFDRHIIKAIQVLGDTTAPAPPPSVQVGYDGVRLNWNWQQSATFGVRGYVLRDELDRFIAQVGADTLSFVETAQADSVTRRVYAVNSTGILSSSYAEITWVKPLPSNWINTNNVTIGKNNALTSGSSANYATRAVFNHAIMTDWRAARLSVAPDRSDITQIVGFTYTPTPSARQDYEFAIQFEPSGALKAYFGDDDQLYSIGTYAAGEEFLLTITPAGDPWAELSVIQILKRQVVNGNEVLTPLDTMNGDFARHAPLYVATSITTSNVTSQLNLQLSGRLVSSVGETPASANNLVNATYNATTGTAQMVTTTPSGCNFTGFNAKQDGFFTFDRITFAGDEGFAAGLNTSDTGQTTASMPFYIFLDEVLGAAIYEDGVQVDTIPLVYATDIIFIGRENGVPTIRVNGVLRARYTGVVDELFTDAVVLDIAFNNGGGLENLKRFPALSYGTTNASTLTSLKQDAFVGENTASSIPPFAVSSAQAAQVLAYNVANKKWTNQAPTIPIGAVITGGAANQVLYQGSDQTFQSSNKFKFDGSDLSLINPIAGTAGTPSQPSPYLYFYGNRWDVGASVNRQVGVRMRCDTEEVNTANWPNPAFIIDGYPSNGNGWFEMFSIRTSPADYLATRMKIGNPIYPLWGGQIEVTYDGIFRFKNADASALSGLSPAYFSWIGASTTGYQSIRKEGTYGTTIQSAFSDPIQIKNPESGFGSSGGFRVESDTSIGHLGSPSAALHVLRTTTPQRRTGYSTGTYKDENVDSSGVFEHVLTGSAPEEKFSSPTKFEVDVKRKAGTGTQYAKIGGKIADFVDDYVSTVTEADAYVKSIVANTFTTNGDQIEAEFNGICAAGTGIKYLKITFAGTTIWDGGDLTQSAGSWVVNVTLIRQSSTTIKYQVTHTFKEAEMSGDVSPKTGSVGSLTFSNAYDLKLRAFSDNAGDLTAKFGWVKYYPAA